MREMDFVVLGSCSGSPASGHIDTTASSNVGGLSNLGTNTFTLCTGTSTIQFRVTPDNPAGDTVNISYAGLPSGSTLTVVNNNTPTPLITFNWSNISAATATYSFYITYRTSSCPLSSVQTQAYTINVVHPNELATHVVAPTDCAHKAVIQYTLTYGSTPRSVAISQGSNVVKSFTDNTGLVTDSLAAGAYTVTITSPDLPCPSVYSLNVTDSGHYPYPPVIVSPVDYCTNDQSVALTATPATGGTLRWYDASNNYLGITPVPSTAVAGTFVYYVNQQVRSCFSDEDTVLVEITNQPVAAFSLSPVTCTGDTTMVTFTGSIGNPAHVHYYWFWDGASYVDSEAAAGYWKVQWPSGGVRNITLQVTENGCRSGIAAHTIQVQPSPHTPFLAHNICAYDTLTVKYDTVAVNGQQFNWSFDGADMPNATSAGPFQLHWDEPGTKHLLLVAVANGCVDSSSKDIQVFPAPQVMITTQPGTVCIGDKIYLLATGADSYAWQPKSYVGHTATDSAFTNIVIPTTYTVTGSTVNGCVDSASITFSDIQPCCNFSYPTAFNPASKVGNNKWRVVTYGNSDYYHLSIFNRWGQRIYQTENPADGWDGTFNGTPQPLDTYYYSLKAHCLAGHTEEKGGEFILVR